MKGESLESSPMNEPSIFCLLLLGEAASFGLLQSWGLKYCGA